MEKLHLDILDFGRKAIFQKLAVFRPVGYLSGGTALALQLGHRVSYDFDIFCGKEVSAAFAARVRKELPVREVSVNNADEFTFLRTTRLKSPLFFTRSICKNICSIFQMRPCGSFLRWGRL